MGRQANAVAARGPGRFKNLLLLLAAAATSIDRLVIVLCSLDIIASGSRVMG